MALIDIEPNYRAPKLTHIQNLCWLARELLGAYMMQDAGMDLEEVDILARQDNQAETIQPLVHATPWLRIGRTKSVHLSNVPYVLAADDTLVPVLESGYVALWAETDEGSENPTGENEAQIIFRQYNPHTRTDAAIFEGFDMDQTSRLGATQTRKLKRLQTVMDGLQGAYRAMMQAETDSNADTYLSQTPMPHLEDTDLFEELARFNGE